ncbi:hypothetical protein [Bacteroides ovatus]|uniref:hypothetical protein n=1 Tax=Bacteroides ovatus TaxID=28116 RepID=UPI0022E15A01|nr:hypothetical protein [Bacteroides ovatus]
MNQQVKEQLSAIKKTYRKEIKEADANPQKWYELFIINDKGNMTLGREPVFKDISRHIPPMRGTMKVNNLHIDIWEDDGIAPLPILELDIKEEDYQLEGLDTYGNKVFTWLENNRDDNAACENIIRQCVRAFKRSCSEGTWIDEVMPEEVWKRCQAEAKFYGTNFQWLTEYLSETLKKPTFDVVDLIFASLKKSMSSELHDSCLEEVSNSKRKSEFLSDILGWDKNWTPMEEEAVEYFREFYAKLV